MWELPKKCGREAFWSTLPDGTTTRDDLLEVNMKMHSVFAGVTSFPLKRVFFQFWRPYLDARRRLVLECFGNPYAIPVFNRRLCKYRTCCTKYRYSVHEQEEKEAPPPPWLISGGPVVTAFLNHFPEVILDLRALQGSSPLVDCALECELTCCLMLPVFLDASSDCLGVVECSINHPALLLPIFNDLKRQLHTRGLRIYHVQESWPYNKVPGGYLEPAKIEIENGLKIACEAHDLTLAQVWISSYASDTSRMLLVKLSGYSSVVDDHPVKDFYDKLDVISLKTGEGLAWKTLQTYQPHLCRNIYKLSDNRGGGVLALLSAKCASFVVCLRSTHTGELDYAFEFFWPQSRNHLILLDALLVTLRKYLPSFKFASGEQLGDDELSSSVVDVESNPEGDDGDDDDDDLNILASYRNTLSLFHIPSSSTFQNLLEKLRKEYELDPARTYKVEYRVSPVRWSRLECLETCRLIMDPIRLRVLSEGRQVGWRWRTTDA